MHLCNKSSELEKIKLKILYLLNTKFDVPSLTVHELTDDYFETTFPLTPCEMVYLLHFIEDMLDFKFTKSDIDDICIYTINGLTQIIETKQSFSERRS